MFGHGLYRFSWAALLVAGLLLSELAGYAADRYWQDVLLAKFNAHAADVFDLAEQRLVEYETRLKTAFSQYEANRIVSGGGFSAYLAQLRKRFNPQLDGLGLVSHGDALASTDWPFDEEWGRLAETEKRRLLTWHVPLYPLGAVPGGQVAEAVEARFDLARLFAEVFAKVRLGSLHARVYVEDGATARLVYAAGAEARAPGNPWWAEARMPFAAVELRILLYATPSLWEAHGPGLAAAALGGLAMLLLAWAIRAQHQDALREQRRRHQHDLARYERAESVAFIAHELTQPLSGLLGCIEGPLARLERGAAPPEVLRGDLSAAQAHVLRACDILDEIRGQVGLNQAVQQAVDLSALLRGLPGWAEGEPRLQGIALALRISEQNLRVRANPLGLEMVLHNLLRNAAEAICGSGRGGSICLEAKAAGGYAEIRVTDDGPGLADPQALFTPFKSGKPGGMGMGLVYCQRRVVKDFGGTIQGGNRPEGGAWFAIRLPLLAA